MAIEFSHKGKLWRADTPEEAIKLREALELSQVRSETEKGYNLEWREQNIWTPDVFWDFVNSLGKLQLEFIRVLFRQSEKDCHTLLFSREIAQGLGLRKEIEFAGVLSGLSKQLKRFSLRPHHLYYVDVEWEGKSKDRSFGLEPGFVLAAKELGWPGKSKTPS